MTTVGYGDLHPNTKMGKLTMMVTCLWGAFMISLMVLSVSSMFDLKKNQLLALRHIRLTRSAAKTITRAFKFYREKKKYYQLKLKINPSLAQSSGFIQMNAAAFGVSYEVSSNPDYAAAG
eukprot:CAMPEP_0170496656 /NCGR_PEP_ID=MMETSP0208-20121228/22285_1 /TAXON_ID=197538 /ORGANISM="Strombidium inclinatum, Strain S3" /LENGTH=119 /DNA_ID=CAMNT_0010773257 /DNA_START=1316 /DNA_END=1675 /DNA_ORIENTATION=+